MVVRYVQIVSKDACILIQNFFIGVDGGATKSIVRVEDDAGHLVGQEVSGPANIRLSVEQTWRSVYSALEKILKPLSLSLGSKDYHFHAGMGLAGCELSEAYQAYVNCPHPFKTLSVTTDAHTACLGAHGHRAGAIIVIGTGVVGYQLQDSQINKVGGWGFPNDDEGGGAWLGLEATKIALRWLDGRLPASTLAQAVFAYFACDLDRFVVWSNQANSTQFAELAPLVIQQAQAGDTTACHLLQRAAEAIDWIGATLQKKQTEQTKPLPCSLVGGVAPFVEPFLGEALRSRLVPCQASPDVGAVLMVKEKAGFFTDSKSSVDHVPLNRLAR